MGRRPMTDERRELSLMTRLWAKVLPKPSGCWEWQGSKDRNGYARISFRNYPHLVSRIILSKALNRKLGRLELACHTCDNPSCCNPSHLFLGTHQDNSNDMVQKQRHGAVIRPEAFKTNGLRMKGHLPRFEGEAHPQAKLTEDQVRAIRAMYVPRKVTLKMVAAAFNVDFTTVHDIIRRKSWTHI